MYLNVLASLHNKKYELLYVNNEYINYTFINKQTWMLACIKFEAIPNFVVYSSQSWNS